MVIIITGMQAINKKFLARRILANFNKFSYKNFYADFTNSNFKIFNKEDELVLEANVEKNKLFTENVELGHEVLDYFKAIDEKIFELDIKHNHFVDVFYSLEVDYNLRKTPLVEPKNHKLIHPHTFNDVLFNIRNAKVDTKVISGTFSNYFIDNLKRELPNEEIIVLNIIRNPSASFLMNKKPETKWLTEINPHLVEEIDYERFYTSSLNAIELMKRSDTLTLKFEDIIKNGSIIIKDKVITLLEIDCAFNDYISNFEHEMEILMSEEEFESFNDYFDNYGPKEFLGEGQEPGEYEISDSEILEILENEMPKGLFNSLGYEALTFNEILAPKN